LAAPPRYDLSSSCVNNEVVRFNRLLKKRTELYNNMKLLETDLKREYFTKHGLHLNSFGKEHVALKLAAVVKSFFNQKKVSPICLQWKEDPTISHEGGNIYDLNTSNNKEVIVSQPQLSQSQKKKKKNLGKGSQELLSAINTPSEKEEKDTHPQLAKRKRKKPAL
jgi:hypothetical protein